MTHGSLAFLLGLGSDEAQDGADAARAVREEEASPDGGSGLRRGRPLSNRCCRDEALRSRQHRSSERSSGQGTERGSWDRLAPRRGAHALPEEIALPRHVRGTRWLGQGRLELGRGNHRDLPGRGEAFQAIRRENTSDWKVLCRDREGAVTGGLIRVCSMWEGAGVGHRSRKGRENVWRSWRV